MVVGQGGMHGVSAAPHALQESSQELVAVIILLRLTMALIAWAVLPRPPPVWKNPTALVSWLARVCLHTCKI